MNKKFTKLIAALALLVFMTPSLAGWGQEPILLFHETFGNNTGSARAWDDSYSVKTGVSSVYEDITSYEVSNLKQGKNTTGHVQSGLNQSTSGTDAYVVIGPLHVADYSNLSLDYWWKAGSTKQTYSTSIYYKTSADGTYSQINHSATGATTFVEVNVSLPEAAQTNTLYLKIVWNTSNTQAIIDEVDLQGVSSGGSGNPTYTLSSAVTPQGAGTVALSETSLEEGDDATATATANAHFTFASWSISGTGATLSSTTTNPTTVTMGTENATVTATFTEDPKYNITYNANYTGSTDEPVVVSDYAGASMTIAPYSTFTRTGYAITRWNTAANGEGTTYNAGDSYTMTSAGLTLYAQWEESNEVVDELTVEWTGVSGTTYTAWSGKTITNGSGAVYAGNTSNNGGISLRTKNSNEGIITTTSGGLVRKVAVTWQSTTANRTINVYGKNSPYSAVSDLFNTDNQGTLLGTIVYGTSTELSINGDYTYVGLRSSSDALVVDPIQITWEPYTNPAVATTTTIDASGITNTDVYTGAAAGSLSATVKDNNNETIAGAAVTWSGNNDAVATIDASTGAVTLVAAGTVTFTASYAGVANEYLPSSDTYEMTVTNNAPYVQPTEIEIVPNYTFWGKESSFSGNTYDELSGLKDNVSLNWTRGSGSTYANQNAMRFYKDNTLTFTAPTGYEIKSILITGTLKNDEAFSPTGFNSSTQTWSGSSSTVTMTRPSNADSYATYSKFTITIGLPSSVATPTFSPEGGTYTEVQNVTISCETAGVTIYYTTDGTTPSATNGTQGTSVAINTTTTLKAIAIKDNESSAVATAVYTLNLPQEFATIAAFKAAFSATSSEVVKITGPLTVVYQHGISTYVQDATGGLLIYDSGDEVTRTYENGQTISNIYGTYTKYKGLVEFVPERDLPVAGTGTVVEPTDITSLTSANYSQYESMLVRLSDIMFAENATLSTTGNIENVTMYIDDEYTEVVLRNGFKTLAGNIAEADMANVTGFATIYSNTIQLFPRDNNDVQMILSTTEVNSAVTVDFAAILGSNDMIEINYGGSLTIGGTFINEGNEENIIIEDGGQLYTNDVVEATIKKTILPYNPNLSGQGVSNGWYFISLPLNSNGGWGYAPTEVVNLIPNNDVESTQYDLYLFDPSADMEWVNYKAHQDEGEFLLYNGHGYLYSNAADVTLEFAGSVNYPEPEISLEQGYNLVGNPYTYNAYPSVSYYKMNDDHTGLSAVIANTVAVEPCTGIIVDNSDGEIPEITFSKSGGAKGGINLTLAETKRGVNKLDNAIVSFNEGSQLGKFYFGTQNANLYIPQGTEEYAIVSTEAQGEMPVNFHANENGQYTITVNPENVEMNYLHLIDNMTGANVDLLQTPSYTFNAKTTDYESRFRLVFASNDASTGSASDETFAFFSNGNLIVNNSGEATLQVIDITGRILSSETVEGSVSKTINATPGVYMLRLVNGDNVRTQKIVVE